MTAHEARVLCDLHTKNKITHTLEDVYLLIKEECEKGGVLINFDGNISEVDSKKLSDDGFDVYFHKNFKGLSIQVSWMSCFYNESIG